MDVIEGWNDTNVGWKFAIGNLDGILEGNFGGEIWRMILLGNWDG